MDINHDQVKNSSVSVGHGSHEVHLCHRCGWPFPNPHPSSRHRRAHKKICGTIEGYKLSIAEQQEQSDEDDRTPSPKSEKKSISGGIGNMSRAYSGFEVFSDAAEEFSDSGLIPTTEERMKGVSESKKNVEDRFDEGQSLKVDAAADVSKISSQVSDPKVVETTDNPPLKESKSEIFMDSSTVLIKENEEILDSEAKDINDAGLQLQENTDGNAINEAELQLRENTDVKAINEAELQLQENATDVKAELQLQENIDLKAINEAEKQLQEKTDVKAINEGEFQLQENIDVKAINEVELQSRENTDVKAINERELQLQQNTEIKAINEADLRLQENTEVKAIDEGELQLQENTDVKAINEADSQLQENADVKAINEGELPFQENSDVKASDLKKVEIDSVAVEKQSEQSELEIVKAEVESVEKSNEGSVEVCEEKDESFHVLSVAKDIPAIEQPEILIEDFKDHKAVESKLEMSLDDLPIESESVENAGESLDTTVIQSEISSTKEEPVKFLEDSRMADAKTSHGTTSVDEKHKGCDDGKFLVQPVRASADVDLSAENDGEEPGKFPEDSGILIEDSKDHKAVQVVKEEPITSAVEVSEKDSDKSVREEPVMLLDDSRVVETKTTYGSTTVDEQYEGCDDDKILKQPISASADVDLSVDSLSQTDSLEGNWGSVSVLSFQSDVPANNTVEALKSNGTQPPTLKPEEENLQNPKVENLQQDVVEPKGSQVEPVVGSEIEKPKKNKEIIAKMEKQHTNLKNLLNDASSETKPTTTTINNNDNGSETKKVKSVEDKKERVDKEWNSPAKYPTDSINKEKRKAKGKSIWVPFICCSSAN